MVILISKNSKTHAKDSVEWSKETELQDFIVENSQTIFSEFLHKDVKICPIGRELDNGNGRADIIFLDQTGSLYVVEAKLDFNNDRRRIFAQLTGYMGAVRNQCTYQTFDDFINDCEESIQNKFKFSGTFNEYLQQKFKIDEKSINEIKNNLKNNITNNSVFGIIIMDVIDNPLKLDIDYQLTNNFKICGIELQKHSEDNTFFVVPQYYGLEKLFLDEKKDPSWYKKHVEGWYIYNAEIQKNQDLDENTKKNILKLTASLENIPGSEGWVMKSNNKLKPYFEKFNDWEDLVLTIDVYGDMNFHLKKMFKNDPKLYQDFINQLYKIVPVSEKLENRTYYHRYPEQWIPKVDEFIALFEKFYS